MLERAFSTRRSPPTNTDEIHNDESKKKKQDLISSFLMRASTSLPPSIRYFPIFLCILLPISLFFLYFSFTRQSSATAGISGVSAVSYCSGTDFGLLGVPWCRPRGHRSVPWNSKDLLKGLEEFTEVYQRRPIKNNLHGMGFDHSFGLWFIAKWLQPLLMIESGVFKGHSTWVLRQAVPDAPIVSLSPRHPEKYLRKGPAYVDRNCTYFAGKEFVDFGSLDWESVVRSNGVTDLSRVLVFFDDHQNELKRVKQALRAGMRHIVFEDNYDTGTGDHYSLRQVCDQVYIRGGGHSCYWDGDEGRMRQERNKYWEKGVDIEELCGPGEAWWGVRGEARDNFNHSNKVMSYEEHFRNSLFLESVLDVYWELPPVAGPSLTHQTRYDPARSVCPIVEDGRFGLFQRLGLSRFESSVFNGYTQMVYIQVSKDGS